MARKRSNNKFKGIVIIAVAVLIPFFIIDATGCALRQGVEPSTLDQDDFLYGDFMPLFCNLLDYNDSQSIGVLIQGQHQQEGDFTDYVFDGTQDLEGLEGFEIPFDDPVPILIIEDPDGVQDTEIPQEELDMLQNMTEGTNPIVNATEVDPPEMLPPEPTPVNEFVIIAEVTKIFTDGTIQTESSEFQFIPLQLFVEDTSNKDFSQGRIITKLSVRSDPNTFVEGSGKFDMFLNNMTLNPTPTDFTFSGTTSQNGTIPVQFISPTGVPSDDILLNIEPIATDISLTGITPLEFKIFDVTATVNTFDYEISGEQNVFEFDFFRDPNIILIIDSSGNEVRGFPTDDLFSFGATNGGATLKRCYKNTRYSCWMTSSYSVSLGSPTIASFELRNSNGDLLFQTLSPFTNQYIVNQEPITRNDTYTVKYGRVTSATAGSLPAGQFTFTTPETQMNYAYRCAIAQATAVIGSGWCSSCTSLTGSPYLTCNFPQ